MRPQPMADPDCFAQRWVVCIDWLGFSNFILSQKKWIKPFIEYSSILDCIPQRDKNFNVNCTWFSDTFIFYTDDNSYQSYGHLKVYSTDFIDCALRKHIPMCGAMAFGDLYADRDHNIFFGKALIEAYEYTVCQDWIGFVLCPSAIKRIEELKREKGTEAEIYDRLNFKYWEVPLKKKIEQSERQLSNHLLAYRLGRALGGHNTREGCISILESLRNEAVVEVVRKKYQNTIDFLQKT